MILLACSTHFKEGENSFLSSILDNIHFPHLSMSIVSLDVLQAEPPDETIKRPQDFGTAELKYEERSVNHMYLFCLISSVYYSRRKLRSQEKALRQASNNNMYLFGVSRLVPRLDRYAPRLKLMVMQAKEAANTYLRRATK